jgi:hypothetical protein
VFLGWDGGLCIPPTSTPMRMHLPLAGEVILYLRSPWIGLFSNEKATVYQQGFKHTPTFVAQERRTLEGVVRTFAVIHATELESLMKELTTPVKT